MYKNQLRGRKAQHKGKEFEQIIERACNRDGIAFKKSDPPMRTDGHGKVWRERSGADCVMGFDTVMVICDMKSFDSDRISYSDLVKHQVDELAKWQGRSFSAGYLIWFREIDIIGWVPVSDLLKINPGESLKYDKSIILGNSLDFKLGRLFSLQWEQVRCQNCRSK